MRIMLALTGVLARLYFGSNGPDPAIFADKQYDSHASSTAAPQRRPPLSGSPVLPKDI